jgi:hypothetical protein
MFLNIVRSLIGIIDIIDSNKGTELDTTLLNCPFESIMTL